MTYDEQTHAETEAKWMTIEPDQGGFRITWPGDSLNFIWQTRAQVEDMERRLSEALSDPSPQRNTTD